MYKVEVLQDRKGYFCVQVTFRDPCEDLFEIARHNYRFGDKALADKLAQCVLSAVRANMPYSPSQVLNEDHWDYVSSVYEHRMAKQVATVYYCEGER